MTPSAMHTFLMVNSAGQVAFFEFVSCRSAEDADAAARRLQQRFRREAYDVEVWMDDVPVSIVSAHG